MKVFRQSHPEQTFSFHTPFKKFYPSVDTHSRTSIMSRKKIVLTVIYKLLFKKKKKQIFKILLMWTLDRLLFQIDILLKCT